LNVLNRTPDLIRGIERLERSASFDELRARPEFYRRNERKFEPLMVIPRPGSEPKAAKKPPVTLLERSNPVTKF